MSSRLFKDYLSSLHRLTPFEAYRLKVLLENQLLNSTPTLPIIIGQTYTYFDEEHRLLNELVIQSIHETKICGLRCSDNELITIPLVVVALAGLKEPPNTREKIQDARQLPYRTRVIAELKTNLVPVYFSKFNYGGSWVRPLSGDSFKLPRFTELYEPTLEEHAQFDAHEQAIGFAEQEQQALKKALLITVSSLEALHSCRGFKQGQRVTQRLGFRLEDFCSLL